MNIFALHPDPRIAAAMHCDQHLNKMIVESAQMASTALRHCGFRKPWMMKQAYPQHPCTLWITGNFDAFLWMTTLARSLEAMRTAATENAASAVIRAADRLIRENFPDADWKKLTSADFIYVGDEAAHGQDVFAKYRNLYRIKQHQWQDTKWPMTYKHRPVPKFLRDLIPCSYPEFSDEQLLSFYSLENIE
jgi:hypothetical protein